MLDQRLRESSEAVKAALADAVVPATEELPATGSPVARDKVGWRGPLIAITTAAVILLVVASATLLLRGEGSTGEPAATTIPAPETIQVESLDDPSRGGFVPGDDDLCEWATEEEIAVVAREAFKLRGLDWEGTVTIVERGPAAGESDWDCVWDLEGTSAEGVSVSRFVSVRVLPGGLPTDPDLVEITEYTEDQPFERTTGVFVSGYPGVDENIVVGPAMWTGFIFWVNGTDLAIEIDSSDSGDPGKLTIAFANTILERLRQKP